LANNPELSLPARYQKVSSRNTLVMHVSYFKRRQQVQSVIPCNITALIADIRHTSCEFTVPSINDA